MVKSVLQWAFVWILSTSSFSANMYHYFGDPNDINYQKYRQAEQKLIEAKPDLIALQEQYSSDIEILSGLGFLVRRQSDLHEGLEFSPYTLLKLALEIDPNDKPSLFVTTFFDVGMYGAKRFSDLESGIKGLILNAEQRHTKAIINPRSSFSKYFTKELEKEKAANPKGPVHYVIQDPDMAVAKVKAVLDQEAIAILKSIHEAQCIDDNAVYHYFNAYVYLMLDDIKSAIEELKSGTRKQMTTYLDIQNERIRKVLNAIGYPESMKVYILDGCSPFEDFVNTRIWNPEHAYYPVWKYGLKEYTAELEKRGSYSEAKKIYRLLEIVSEQCQSEQIRPLGLGKLMKRKIEEVQKKTR